MITPRTILARRVQAALDASPSRIPILLGGCGSGRTTLVLQLRDRIGRGGAQYVDVERTATTPDRFFRGLVAQSPFPTTEPLPSVARAAFQEVLAFLGRARTGGGQTVAFLLDEFLEMRTFESFPGLRHALCELLDAIEASANRFVLSSRYTARSLKLVRDRPARFEVIHISPLTVEDTLDMLDLASAGATQDADFLARTVHALADGRPWYVQALSGELASMRERGGAGSNDPIAALTSLLAPEGRLSIRSRFCYELRLNRARGYGALKAILEILAEDEGLTLTQIAQRLQRTPGSTKDYLSWLEDVDLIVARQKRYSFTDPLLRLWVRLFCRASAPTEEDIAREVHAYSLPRLPQAPAEPAFAMAGAGGGDGIIEID
jgi:hypothetical protein